MLFLMKGDQIRFLLDKRVILMAENIGVALDEKTIEGIGRLVSSGKYRNRSHVVEYAVNSLIKKESDMDVRGKADEERE